MTTSKAEKAARAAKRAEAIAEDLADAAGGPTDEFGGDISEIFEGLPSEADLRLYKKGPTGRLDFCESYPEPKDFSEEGVQRTWGPGSYRLIARVPDPKTGKLVFAKGKSKVFSIAAPPSANGAGPAAPQGPQDFEKTMAATLYQMLLGQMQQQQQMMSQSQESHRAMLAMMMQPRPDSTTDLLKLLLPTLLQRENPMDVAMKMADLLKPAGPAASLTEQISVMEKFMDLARKGESPESAPVWFQAFKEAAPLIEKALSRGAPQPQPVRRRELPPPVPPGPADAPNPPLPKVEDAPPAPVEENPLLAALDALSPMLVKAAARDADPDLYAEFVLDQVPEDTLEALDFMLQTDAVAFIVGRYPVLAPHQGWVERVVAAMRQQLGPEDGEDGEAPPVSESVEQ